MARSDADMIRDILGWPISDERKVELVKQIAGVKLAAKASAASAPVGKPAVKARRRARKAAAKAAAKPAAKPPKAAARAPERVIRHRRRSLLRGEGSAYTLRSRLWSELKRTAPEKLEGLSYAKASNEQLQALIEEVKKKQ